MTLQYKQVLIENIAYLALMAQGGITLNELWDVPVRDRQLYIDIIQQWHKNNQELYKAMLKSGQGRCPLMGK